jgi:hypothetical protein
LFNKITGEIAPHTLVEWYNVTEKNLKTVEHKLNSFGVYTWQICRMILSDDFIGKFQDKMDWRYISSNYPLTEIFIEEFPDKINWEAVSRS